MNGNEMIDAGADLHGWWREYGGATFRVAASDREHYVTSHVPGEPLMSTTWPIATARRRIAAGLWTRAEAPLPELARTVREVSGEHVRCACGLPMHRNEARGRRGVWECACGRASEAPPDPRGANVRAARAAEAHPPDVRGLLLFGQRRGPAWERFRLALAREVESCNVRPDPVALTHARILVLAQESVRED